MEKEENEAKRKKQQSLLDDLENNRHLSAQQVLAMHEQNLDMESSVMSLEERITISQQEVAGISSHLGKQGVILPDILSGRPYAYKSVEEDILGPSMPSRDDVLNNGYLNNVRQATESDIGGGYSSLTACSRALQDAYTGLLWRPCSTIDGIV